MSKIFDQFNQSAKDGSFQEWLKNNPDGDPNVNMFLENAANAIQAASKPSTSEVNHAWHLSYKTGWWIFKKTIEIGVFATHDQALDKIREIASPDGIRDFYLKRI
jgi:hypothetical protein